MGKSKTIADQGNLNKQFQQYIDEMTQSMEKQAVSITGTIDNMVKSHYQTFPDKAELLTGQYSHLTTFSEWSLNSITTMIDSCRKTIFGTASVPEGSEKETTSPEVTGAIAALKARELLIANAAFDIVQSILSSFSTSTTTTVSAKLDTKPLDAGLTLFIGVLNNVYNRKDFFNNEKISQNIFIYKVYYSIKEGQSVSQLDDLGAYENQKAAFRTQLQKLDQMVANLDVFKEDYLDELAKCTARADALNKCLQAIDDKLKSLSQPSDAPRLKGFAKATGYDAITQRIKSRHLAARA
jgi:hypothetical protein